MLTLSDKPTERARFNESKAKSTNYLEALWGFPVGLAWYSILRILYSVPRGWVVTRGGLRRAYVAVLGVYGVGVVVVGRDRKRIEQGGTDIQQGRVGKREG